MTDYLLDGISAHPIISGAVFICLFAMAVAAILLASVPDPEKD